MEEPGPCDPKMRSTTRSGVTTRLAAANHRRQPYPARVGVAEPHRVVRLLSGSGPASKMSGAREVQDASERVRRVPS